jgi:hypothetical protein
LDRSLFRVSISMSVACIGFADRDRLTLRKASPRQLAPDSLTPAIASSATVSWCRPSSLDLPNVTTARPTMSQSRRSSRVLVRISDWNLPLIRSIEAKPPRPSIPECSARLVWSPFSETATTKNLA